MQAKPMAAGSDDGPQGDPALTGCPFPRPGPGQVLVKIKRIGICGSDIHVYHGKHPYTKYPVTQGPRGLRPGRGAGGGSHPIPGGSAGDH